MSDSEDFIENLILQGGLEITGLDSETGEMLFSFTEKLAEIDPGLYIKMIDSFRNDIMSLWQKGFLNMDVTTSNPIVSATKKIFDKDAVAALSESERVTLKDVMSKMSD